jgi:hypothetical protein
MRIFKNKDFHAWAISIGLDDCSLKTAVIELSQGLYEANLGGHIYKKRIRYKNKGKRSGLRTIVAFKKEDKVYFIYGFAKNKKATLMVKEEIALKKYADFLFSKDSEINKMVKKGILIEVKEVKRDEKINT